MASIILNGKIRYLQEGEVLEFPDFYDNMVRVQHTKLQAGDQVVIFQERSGKLLSHVPTEQYILFTVKAVTDLDSGCPRVKMNETGGSWALDLAFKFIEEIGKGK